MLVYSLARIGRSVPTTTLILAGVAISSFATSLTSFLMLRSNEQLSARPDGCWADRS